MDSNYKNNFFIKKNTVYNKTIFLGFLQNQKPRELVIVPLKTRILLYMANKNFFFFFKCWFTILMSSFENDYVNG